MLQALVFGGLAFDLLPVQQNEVKGLRWRTVELREVVAELILENRLLKKA